MFVFLRRSKVIILYKVLGLVLCTFKLTPIFVFWALRVNERFGIA